MTKFLNTLKENIKNLGKKETSKVLNKDDEEYLAKSVDIYDLERRMKKLEKGKLASFRY